MAKFSQNFSLKDIFNNKKLRGKIPLINYKEPTTPTGREGYRTSMKTVSELVKNTAVNAARPFYKPLKPILSNDMVILDGNLDGDHDAAVDAVYNAISAQKSVISYTANNGDIIRDALKESEKTRRTYGLNSKLYLRVQSMQEIEGMSKWQIEALMSDIMENIVYGDDFPATKEKWNVQNMPTNSRLNYAERKAQWERKVGK